MATVLEDSIALVFHAFGWTAPFEAAQNVTSASRVCGALALAACNVWAIRGVALTTLSPRLIIKMLEFAVI